jgi:hypothetical protein
MARSGFSTYGLVLASGDIGATWPWSVIRHLADFGTTKPVKKRAANSNLELQFWVVYLFFFRDWK